MIKFWKFHLRPWSGLKLFPRDVATRNKRFKKDINGNKKPVRLNRTPIMDENQYVESLRGVYKTSECYVQVFSDWQIRNKIFDTIFFEFDVKGGKYLDEIIEEILFKKAIIDNILDENDLKHREFFTGGRGFHYFLDFKPTKMKDYRATVEKFMDDIGLSDHVDHQVLESARISRIPFTKHLKYNNFSVFVDGFLKSEIIDATRNNKILVKDPPKAMNDNLVDMLDLEITRNLEIDEKEYSERFDGYFPTCVVRMIEKLMTTHYLDHFERKHLVGYLRRFKYSDSEIMNYLKMTDDFDIGISQRMLDSLKGYVNHGCDRVRKNHPELCPGSCHYIRQVARRLSECED